MDLKVTVDLPGFKKKTFKLEKTTNHSYQMIMSNSKIGKITHQRDLTWKSTAIVSGQEILVVSDDISSVFHTTVQLSGTLLTLKSNLSTLRISDSYFMKPMMPYMNREQLLINIQKDVNILEQHRNCLPGWTPPEIPHE